MGLRFLLVEDDRLYARTLHSQLHALGLDACHELTAAEGLDHVLESRPDLVLLSPDLPERVDGLAAGACMCRIADLLIVYLARASTSESMRSRLAAACSQLLEKPCSLDGLFAALQFACSSAIARDLVDHVR